MVIYHFLGEFQLYDADGSAIWFNDIQGGEFTPAGNLVLLVQNGSHGSGLYIFDLRTGYLVDHLWAEIHESDKEEFEGVTVWDIEGYNGQQGQIHAILVDEVWWRRIYDFYFKHWSVAHPNEL